MTPGSAPEARENLPGTAASYSERCAEHSSGPSVTGQYAARRGPGITPCSGQRAGANEPFDGTYVCGTFVGARSHHAHPRARETGVGAAVRGQKEAPVYPARPVQVSNTHLT